MHSIKTVSCEEINDIKEKYNNLVYEIEGGNINTINDYFDEIYNMLGFPQYNKYSYDAYIDWMRDDYFKYHPIVFIINNYQLFLRDYPKEKQIIIDIFNEDIIPYWNNRKATIGDKTEFVVYLVNDN